MTFVTLTNDKSCSFSCCSERQNGRAATCRTGASHNNLRDLFLDALCSLWFGRYCELLSLMYLFMHRAFVGAYVPLSSGSFILLVKLYQENNYYKSHIFRIYFDIFFFFFDIRICSVLIQQVRRLFLYVTCCKYLRIQTHWKKRLAEYGIAFLIGCSSQFLIALVYRDPILKLRIG